MPSWRLRFPLASPDAEALGLEPQFPSIGPECIKGIEINAYAAELARVTVWIGEIQWMRRNGFELERKPILRPLDTIECRDVVMNPDGSEAQKIAAAAKRLNELRNNWLNPSDLVMHVPEVVAGYPDRIVPKDAAAAQVLKQRTLTNLYNERPAWLDNAHRDLDRAVADVYGWKPDMSDNEMLTKLLALNLERAKEHPRQ
jgi:type II restriction/modification system DNA methylase subunit YeeA